MTALLRQLYIENILSQPIEGFGHYNATTPLSDLVQVNRLLRGVMYSSTGRVHQSIESYLPRPVPVQ